MITPTMTPLEAAHDARQDRGALFNKIKSAIAVQERKHRKECDRNCILETHLNWRSPRGNNWLLVVRTNRKETDLRSLAWYRGKDGRLRAVYVGLLNDATTYFSAHFLDRYLLRFDPSRNPIQRLQDLFFTNHDIATQTLEDLGNGQYKVMAGLVHGLGTGIWDSTTQLVSITTFLDYGMLSDEQMKLADALDFQRELLARPAGFRAHVLRLLEEERKKAA